MDSYSKMILGYSVGMTLETKYPMEALKDAVRVLRSYGVNLSATIHHSDRGVQYTCSDYVTELRKHKVGRFYYLIFQTGASRQNLIKPRLSAFVSCKINDLV